MRFQSGRELARALRQVRGQSLPLDLRTEPVPLPRPNPISGKTLRFKWRRWAGAAAALVVSMASASIWLAWPVERTVSRRRTVRKSDRRFRLEQYRLALTQTLTLSFGDSRDLQVTPYGRVLELLSRFLGEGADVSIVMRSGHYSNTGAALVVVPTLLRDGGAGAHA